MSRGQELATLLYENLATRLFFLDAKEITAVVLFVSLFNKSCTCMTIVGCYTLRSFAHHVACCCKL